MAELQAFCAQRDLFLLEDAAHALGSTLNGQQAGTFGDAASFSFYPTKIVTSGEGGVLVTNSEEIETLRELPTTVTSLAQTRLTRAYLILRLINESGTTSLILRAIK